MVLNFVKKFLDFQRYFVDICRILQGERPYWWVFQNQEYLQVRFIPEEIKQFSLTCETGPGSPSGHVMVSASVWYFMIHLMIPQQFSRILR